MERLIDLTAEYTTIAVAGMCKNAGKTTVVNHLIGQYNSVFMTGLTSIGYDGEEVDEITMLDKPRIKVHPGMLVATCGICLTSSTAGYKEVRSTGIRTVLGEIIIIKITSTGIVEVSGPVTVLQMDAICRDLQKLGCRKVIVDGAAGRLSFISTADCAILAVGAAMSSSMTKVVREAKHQIGLLELGPCIDKSIPECPGDVPYVTKERNKEIICAFRGPAVDKDINEIIKHFKGFEKILIVKDAAAIFISPAVYKKLLHSKGSLCVMKTTNFAAITVNPMSPYGKWFNKDRFLREMREHVSIPVLNVMDDEI